MNIQLIVGAILLSLMGFLGFENWQLKKEIAIYQTNDGALRSQLREFGDLLEAKNDVLQKCSDKTKQLVEEGEKRARDAEVARTQAREAGKKNRELADELLKFKRKTGETSCDAANRLFDEYLDKKR